MTCRRCGAELPARTGPGRPRAYCSGACKVASWRAAQLPTEMTSLRRWVRHDAAKRPMTVTGRPASATDPATWCSWARARASRAGEGVGFVLAGDGIVCIDLDHALCDGQLVPWAAAVVARCSGTYIEISRSGTGLHIFGRGTVTRGRRIRDGRCIEIYGDRRYIAVTGRRWPGAPARLADLTSVLGELTAL